jgi:hypothetical protein
MTTEHKPHSELPEHARDWIKIPPPPERLEEIRHFADSDVLDLVEPEEMYYFLGLQEQLEAARETFRQIARMAGADGTEPEDWRAMTYPTPGEAAFQAVCELRGNYDEAIRWDGAPASNPASGSES